MNENNMKTIKLQKIEDNIKKISKLLNHIDTLSKELSMDNNNDNDNDNNLKGDAEEENQCQGPDVPLLDKSKSNGNGKTKNKHRRGENIILPSLSL